MNITRRHSLMAATALGLAGCTTTPTLSQLAQYAQAAANAGAAVLAQIPNPPAVLQTAIAALKSAASAVIGAGINPAASVAQQVYDAIKVVLPLASPFVSAVPGVGIAISAIEALLPFIAQAAGLTAAVAAAPTVPGVPVMTVQQALKLYGGAA